VVITQTPYTKKLPLQQTPPVQRAFSGTGARGTLEREKL